MRHALANALYSVARIIDRPSVKCEGGKQHFGDPGYSGSSRAGTTWSMNLHSRDDTPISADFHPPEYNYTYAALHIAEATVFLTRRSTLALLDVLRPVSEQFAKHGEGRKS